MQYYCGLATRCAMMKIKRNSFLFLNSFKFSRILQLYNKKYICCIYFMILLKGDKIKQVKNLSKKLFYIYFRILSGHFEAIHGHHLP
jgi:hypothetical protein